MTTTPEPTKAPRRRGRIAVLAVAGGVLAAGVTLAVTGVATASPTAPTAPTAPVTEMSPVSAISAAAPDTACADGPWRVAGAAIEGEPLGFEHGDPGRTYLWHDGAGWHLRTTDISSAAHHYSGTVAASPGASFVDVGKVRLDPGDRLWVDRGVLHYDFTTHAGVDGIDFRVTACNGARDHEELVFVARRGGVADAGLVDLGEHRAHPGSDPFTATR